MSVAAAPETTSGDEVSNPTGMTEGESAALIDGELVDPFEPIVRSPGDDVAFAIVNVFSPDVVVEVDFLGDQPSPSVEVAAIRDPDVGDEFRSVVEGRITIPRAAPGIHELQFRALGGVQRSIELYVEVQGTPTACTDHTFFVDGLEPDEYATIDYGGLDWGEVQADRHGKALVSVFLPGRAGTVAVTLTGETTGELAPVELTVAPGTCEDAGG